MSNWKVSEIRELVSDINELSLKIGSGRVILQEGTQKYGRAWRLFQLGGDSAWYNHPHFGEYLGWTKNEAGRKLVLIKYKLEIIAKEVETNQCRHCLQPLPEGLRH